MIETLKHKEVYEYYYGLGEKRSCQAVGNKFAISRQSIQKWSKAFNWQKRTEQRDIEIGEQLKKKTNKIVLNTKADYREEIQQNIKILKSAIRTAFIKGQDGKLKLNIAVTSVSDLNQIINATEKLIKLDMALIGEGIVEQKDTTLIIKFVDSDGNKISE